MHFETAYIIEWRTNKGWEIFDQPATLSEALTKFRKLVINDGFHEYRLTVESK